LVSEVEFFGVNKIKYLIGWDDEIDESDNETDEGRASAAGTNLTIK
jgi:hypothetical protein